MNEEESGLWSFMPDDHSKFNKINLSKLAEPILKKLRKINNYKILKKQKLNVPGMAKERYFNFEGIQFLYMIHQNYFHGGLYGYENCPYIHRLDVWYKKIKPSSSL